MTVETVLLERRIRRLERRIETLYGDAYNAYWNIGDLACLAIENKIKSAERELVRLEAGLHGRC